MHTLVGVSIVENLFFLSIQKYRADCRPMKLRINRADDGFGTVKSRLSMHRISAELSLTQRETNFQSTKFALFLKCTLISLFNLLTTYISKLVLR